MTRFSWVHLALLLVIPGFFLTASCGKKQIQSETGMTTEQPDAGMEKGTIEGEMTGQEALEEQRLREQRLREEAKARRQRAEKEAFLNEHVYFEFDKSTLLDEAKVTLKKKAAWLEAHPNVSVTIEGHCDERGTSEYNMALGDRRARSVRNYLMDLGIRSRRMNTVSYGEEKPIALGHNEAAWAKNRRAQFVME
jgi:peptidoglycan-associated lipoprotein